MKELSTNENFARYTTELALSERDLIREMTANAQREVLDELEKNQDCL